jgi:hypothetical protein
MGRLASDAQCAIRASKAIRERREYGIACPERAAFYQWLAWQRGEGPQRRGLEPLGAAEAIWWRAVFELAPEAACEC